MAKSTQALSQYRTMMSQAEKLANKAAEEVWGKAREHIAALKSLSDEHEELTGKPLPEYKRSPSAPKRDRIGGGGHARTSLKGAYAGMTVRDAIKKSLKGVKNGLGPAQVAEKIGGNKDTVTVAMSTMAKDGELTRPSRGRYTL